MYKFNKSSQAGQASRLLLVLAMVVLVAGVIVFLVMKMATPAPKPKTTVKTPDTTVNTKAPDAVYEKQLGNIKFSFQSATNRGTTLNSSDVVNNQNGSQIDSLSATSGGRFIQVTIGAQNEGKLNIDQESWDIGNIVDSQGRNFVPMNADTVSPWIFNSNSCGSLLMPAFDPTPCTKIYQVSDESKGLKITVENKEKSSSGSVSLSGKAAATTFLLDLVVK